MAELTNNTTKKRSNLGLVIGICTTIIAVIVIVVAAIFAINNNQLNDSYFVSDDTKLVYTTDKSDIENNDNIIKIHEVYSYSGDTITDLKAYHLFENADMAKQAFDEYKNDEKIMNKVSDIEQKGNYVILTYDQTLYDGMTTTDVRQQIEFLNSLNDSNNNTNYTESDIDDTEVIENTTEETENTTENEAVEVVE